MNNTVPNIKKINYFYIDESGSLQGDSNVFIHGCIKTDSPRSISQALCKLKTELADDLFFDKVRNKILKKGFHACENDADIQAAVYKLILLLDYRAYFVVLNKETEFYKKTFEHEYEWFTYSLRKLLKDRILANIGAENHFYFETIRISKKSLNTIITEIFSELGSEHDCQFKIVGKDVENLVVVDYLNYLIYHLFSNKKEPMPKMKNIFDLVSQKIGAVNMLHNGVFLSRKKPLEYQINLENLVEKYGRASE